MIAALAVGGMMPVVVVRVAANTSKQALAASMRPVAALVTVTGTGVSRSPNTSSRAATSARSSSGTPTPSAKTTPMSDASSPARASADRIASASPPARTASSVLRARRPSWLAACPATTASGVAPRSRQ